MALLTEACRAAAEAVRAYRLMPNHVHLILVPSGVDGLRAALSEGHRRYSRRINFRAGWRGYLRQGRFASTPMYEDHLIVAARYVELNPLRARLAARPEACRWWSGRAHLAGRDDGVVQVQPLLERAPDSAAFLGEGLDDEAHAAMQSAERTGRPLGGADCRRRPRAVVGPCARAPEAQAQAPRCGGGSGEIPVWSAPLA